MSPLKSQNALGALLAALLGFTVYPFALSEGNLGYLEMSYAVLFGVFLIFRFGTQTPQEIATDKFVVWVLFATLLIFGVAINSNRYDDVEFRAAIIHVIGLSMLFYLLLWSATTLDPMRIMAVLGLTISPLILYVTATSFEEMGISRANPYNMHPNWWGELLFCYSACALVMRNRIISGLMLGVALLLLYLLQSRGALIAIVAMIGVYLVSTFRYQPRYTGRYVVGAVLGIVAIATAVWRIGLSWISDFVLEDVLFLDDSYRGLGTDFVDRVGGWRLAWETFLDNPLFGNGLDTMAGVHNGFLRLAAEGGLTMVVLVSWVSVTAIIGARRTRSHVALAVIVGYFVMVLFAPRFLNMNLASTVFFLSLLPWKRGKQLEDRKPIMQIPPIPKYSQ